MEKIKQISNNRKFTWSLLGIGILLIMVYYFSKVPQIYSVWELVDEYGYLANAAFLSGNTWPYLTHMYYGYGYSLLLVPLFWFCNTGAGIIRGAVMLNALCIALLFLVQYILMSKVCRALNKNLIVVISFVLCFYPYIVASGLKVLCEILLMLMVWVCGLLFYYALETGKWYYYVLLSFATVYTFFVHTRAMVFCGALVLTMVIMFFSKKIRLWHMSICALTAFAVLLLGFAVKNQVISGVYTETYAGSDVNADVGKIAGDIANYVASNDETVVPVQGDTEMETESEEEASRPDQPQTVGNIMSVSYMLNRILDVFQNFSIWYVYAFACRNFYLFAGTAGLFHLGIAAVCKTVISEIKTSKTISSGNAIKLLYTVGAILMLVAVVVQAPGSAVAPAYNFYGRYYEYLIGPVVIFGVDYLVRERVKCFGIVAWLLVFGISYLITMEVADHLEVQEISFDSARMAALGFFTSKQYYRAIVRSAAIAALLVLICNIVLNRSKLLRGFIPGVLLCLFFVNDFYIEREIMALQQENKEDYEMVTYIQENYKREEVYFLNSGFSYPVAYAGIQPLLYQTKLHVLDGEEIQSMEQGDIIISFHNNPYLMQTEQEMSMIYETTYYEVYMVGY